MHGLESSVRGRGGWRGCGLREYTFEVLDELGTVGEDRVVVRGREGHGGQGQGASACGGRARHSRQSNARYSIKMKPYGNDVARGLD